MGQLGWIGIKFWVLFFGGGLQRRGVHVKAPKIGSREGLFCIWRNL
jgi:hypothetical protein